MIVYVSGKYTGNPEEINNNILKARAISVELWSKGYVALCPHLNTANFEQDAETVSYDDYIKGDLQLLSRSDAILMIPGWEESNGARIEYQYAVNNKIPISIYPELPDYYGTEVRYPVQTDRFINILMSMYRMYIKKNEDYSPANILGAGSIGICTRIWDKVARLMNLNGFNIKIASTEYSVPKAPRYEQVEDTFHDMAVYSVIGLIEKEGKWGQ